MIANLELVASDDFVCITDATLIDHVMNTPVTDMQVHIDTHASDAGPVNVHAIMFPSAVTGIVTKTNRGQYDADSSFTRVLKVASCVSLCKTSTADTESGTLDMMYGQNGLPIDTGKALSHQLGRP